MVNNLAIAITTFLFNIIMLKYAGEAGVAPIVSYKYGGRDVAQLKKIFRISIYLVSIVSVIIFFVAECYSDFFDRHFYNGE